MIQFRIKHHTKKEVETLLWALELASDVLTHKCGSECRLCRNCNQQKACKDILDAIRYLKVLIAGWDK
jgi:hypothetical protein